MYFGFFKKCTITKKKCEATVPQLFEEVKKELDLVPVPQLSFAYSDEYEVATNEQIKCVFFNFIFSKLFLMFGLKFCDFMVILCVGFVISIRFLLSI